MTETLVTNVPAQALNSCQFPLQTRRGEYLIQVSWPLGWSADRKPPEGEDVSAMSTIYIVDGNVYFFTGTEVARRLDFMGAKKAIIVAVGYPITTGPFHKRRQVDLTPPARDGIFATQTDLAGEPLADAHFGGAEDFLDVIRTQVMAHVEDTLFPHVPLAKGRRMLFGHSYGGLFALTALFTQPGLFDTVCAASPSIWFNDKAIVRFQEAEFVRGEEPLDPKPRLIMPWGSLEQNLVMKPGQDEAKFARLKAYMEDKKMIDNAKDMAKRLEACPRLRQVWTWEFEGEDHGGAAPCALQRGITKFLDEIIEH